MADLPTALITEILSRLPVKSLLRFRRVSKAWQSLINDPHFIKLHLKRSQQNTTNQTLVLRDCYLYSANFPTLDRAAVIDHPLKSDRIGTALLGSCNGLLCLSNGEQEGEGTILYNPATRKHRELPFSSIEFPDSDFLLLCERIVYGFGYDHVHDDYKVVRIIQFFEQNPDLYDSEVKVYSLKTGSWRRIADFPREYYLSYKRASGVYVNGYLHWVVARKPESDGTQLIVAFDLGSEECRVVPQPKYSTGEFHLNVGVLQGWLCVMSNYPYFRTDVWVMKEYGVKESWVKLFTVSQRKVGPFDYVRPLAMKGSEVLLEQDCANLLWFHLHTQRARSVNMRDMPRSLDAEMMVESLVPLDSHKKKRKRKPKKNRYSGIFLVVCLFLCSLTISCLFTFIISSLVTRLFCIISCCPACTVLLPLTCVDY